MPNCSNCGKEVLQNEKFCASCGSPIIQVDSNQKNIKVEDSKSTQSSNGYTEKPKIIYNKPNSGYNNATQQGTSEYRRTCRNCGQQWHSLASREQSLSLSQTGYRIGALGSAMQGCGTCGMCGGTAAAQQNRNADAQQVELERLKHCPKCGSSNYIQEVVDYTPKPA